MGRLRHSQPVSRSVLATRPGLPGAKCGAEPGVSPASAEALQALPFPTGSAWDLGSSLEFGSSLGSPGRTGLSIPHGTAKRAG